MNKYRVAKIEVDTDELQKMLVGAQLICEGLYSGSMDWNLEGILKLRKDFSREENAYEFLAENYATIQGAVLTVGAILSMANTAINNDDIILTPGDRLQMKPYTEKNAV